MCATEAPSCIWIKYRRQHSRYLESPGCQPPNTKIKKSGNLRTFTSTRREKLWQYSGSFPTRRGNRTNMEGQYKHNRLCQQFKHSHHRKTLQYIYKLEAGIKFYCTHRHVASKEGVVLRPIPRIAGKRLVPQLTTTTPFCNLAVKSSKKRRLTPSLVPGSFRNFAAKRNDTYLATLALFYLALRVFSCCNDVTSNRCFAVSRQSWVYA